MQALRGLHGHRQRDWASAVARRSIALRPRIPTRRRPIAWPIGPGRRPPADAPFRPPVVPAAGPCDNAASHPVQPRARSLRAAFRAPAPDPMTAASARRRPARLSAFDRGGRTMLRRRRPRWSPRGSITAVLGPSGSGKSTLLAALTGELRAGGRHRGGAGPADAPRRPRAAGAAQGHRRAAAGQRPAHRPERRPRTWRCRCARIPTCRTR